MSLFLPFFYNKEKLLCRFSPAAETGIYRKVYTGVSLTEAKMLQKER